MDALSFRVEFFAFSTYSDDDMQVLEALFTEEVFEM